MTLRGYCLSLVVYALTFQASALEREPIKRHVLNYCSKQPTQVLQIKCAVDASKKYQIFKEVIKTKRGKKTVEYCFNKIGTSSSDGLYHLLSCTSRHNYIIENHPYPEFADSKFMVDKMRSEWLSKCVLMFGNEIDGCLASKEQDYQAVFSLYMNLIYLDKQSRYVEDFKRCVPNNFITADYTLRRSCVSL
jgi:hypothetical protein